MTTDELKRTVAGFFSLLSAGDVDGAFARMTDDATWWMAGKRDALPVAGVHDKARMRRILDDMFGRLKSGLPMTITSAIAEGDRVALEMTSRGELRNGRVYEQQYHMLVTVRAGKIAAVKEYLDTQHVFATWFARDPAPAS